VEIKYHHFSNVDSTNSFARRELNSFSDDCWTAISSDTQTKGRGQNGSDWVDSPSDSLLMTIISPEIKWDNSKIMNAQMSGSLAIMNFLVNHGFNARLKWPNDVYIGSGKIAGILSEASWQGDFCNRFFFGLGMNVRNAPDGYSFLGSNYLPEQFRIPLAEVIVNQIIIEKKDIRSIYERSLFHWNIGCDWKDLSTGELFQAKTTGVCADGRLELTLLSGEVRTFANKEVMFLNSNKIF
jgi:BirA family transcriptional regulator, biotin operon repressor / biotin---[acetyl-CoA-carboxylase] ligase